MSAVPATAASRKPSAYDGNPSKTVKHKVRWLAAKYMLISQHFPYIHTDYRQLSGTNQCGSSLHGQYMIC